MNEEIGEQSTLAAGGMPDGRPKPRREGDVVLQAKQAKVFGALFRKPALQRFGRYVVLDVLGQGGMGVVLKGYDDELDRQVAIKVLHRELDAQHTARLRREAQAMAKLSHPNVVQVYEVGEVDGQTFVAMELVKGQTVQAWMQQEPRPSWKACVAVFLQLGQGLAAAHRRGLVHRDFKPGNAVVDEEGRARVLDFGLARRSERDDEERADAGAPTDPEATASLEQSLTRTGAVLGTPAYMPPEQMDGRETDARSDQFSFCVALFEAMYGERPYEGSSMMALMVSMRSGEVRPAPKGSSAPLALRKVLLRGLAVDPAARWPSMEALLEELRRIASPRRWRAVAAVLGGGLVAVGGGLGTTRALEWVNRCTGAEERLEGAWDEARRQEVKVAILGTGLSYAPGTWERVEPRLDAYADAWATEHTDACEATRSRGEESEEELGLRMSCLHGRWQHLRATVNELRHADATVVKKAVQAVASLPGLERCRDLEALRAEVPPPEDPEVAEQVAGLDERLVEAKAKQEAGQYEAGLRLADAVVMEGARLEYEPLMARAWLLQGKLRAEVGDYDGSVQALRHAYGAAVVHTMKAEAAEASAKLVFVLGPRLVRHEEAYGWSEHADVLSRAVGSAGEARARYFNSRGTLASSQGKYDEARSFDERALEIREKALGVDHLLVAQSLGNLGEVAFSQGEYDDARRFHERALAIEEQALGPDHPDTSFSLNSLGNVAYSQGKLEEARALYERARAIRETALGLDHPDVAGSFNNLGALAISQGKLEEARAHFERARAIAETALGLEHPLVATSLYNLANTAESQGKLEEARGFHERALAISEKALGPEHPDVGQTLRELGRLAESRGDHEQARDLHERALAIFEKALGPEHPDVAAALGSLGIAALSQGQHAQARDFHERALAIREKALGSEHSDVAVSLHSLGSVALSRGDHAQARERFERALAIFEKALGPDHPFVAHSLTGLGKALLGLAEPAAALPPLERALIIATHELDPALLADARITLARALWDAPTTQGRARPRARALAEQARDVLREAGADSAKELAEVEAWLAEHRRP